MKVDKNGDSIVSREDRVEICLKPYKDYKKHGKENKKTSNPKQVKDGARLATLEMRPEFPLRS